MADEAKPQPIPVGPGERVTSTPPASNSFAAKGAGLLNSIPEAHRAQFDSVMGIRSEAEAKLQQIDAGASTTTTPVAPKPRSFGIGDVVMDTQRSTKVMILQTNVGKTVKGTPVHLVIHRRTGEEWRLPESKMTKM